MRYSLGIRKGGVRTTGSRSWHYTGIWRHAEIIQDCGTWQRGDADSDRAEHQSGRGTADRTGAEGSRAGRTDADSGSDGEENRLQRKTLLNKGYHLDLFSGCALEAEGFGVCFGTEDQKEGMKAFLNKTKYEYQGK